MVAKSGITYTVDALIDISVDDDLTGEIDIGHGEVVGIDMPDAWTAAGIFFRASHESGGTFDVVHDSDGTELAISAAADRVIGLTQAEREILRGAGRFLQLGSGTSGTTVAQGADRLIKLICREG